MVMASPLLETKLFIPTRRRGLVARLRLSERLNRGTEAKLTLISAPAGFGKTTLLADLAGSRSGQRAIHGVAFPGAERQRSCTVLDVPDHCVANGRTRHCRQSTLAAALVPVADRGDLCSGSGLCSMLALSVRQSRAVSSRR
jgi:hypothetical protein